MDSFIEREWSQFLDPPHEFTPMPMWFWNDWLEPEEIKRQIRDFSEHEVYGFILHPRMGLPPEIPYLSERFLDLVDVAVAEAAARNMLVILYDEGMYPSGSAHGQVVAEDPGYAAQVLERRDAIGGEPVLRPGEKLVSLQRMHQPDGCTPCWTAFVQTRSGGTIRGIHFGEDSREPDAPPASDLMNPKAMQCFMRLTHERYHQRLSRFFGKTVIGMFTDEPSLTGRGDMTGKIPWTDGMMDLCLDHGLRESDLHDLFEEDPAPGGETRARFAGICRHRLAEAYYQPLSRWCADHGISLTGHPAQSDDIGLLRHFQIPGQDLVLRHVGPENGKALEGRDSTLAKCAADAARHAGLRRSSVECFGCCVRNQPGQGWDLPPEDLKWYADWLAVRGVNLFYPHAFYYSLRGRRAYERPPDVGPAQTWWGEYGRFARYLRRLSWMMTDSISQSGLAVLCTENHLPHRLPRHLYQNQLDFHYLEERFLTDPDLRIRDGMIIISGQNYHTLLVEEASALGGETRAMLRHCLNAGVRVFSPGSPDERGWLVEVQGTSRIRPDRFVPDLRLAWQVRKGMSCFLLVNEGRSGLNFSLDCQMEGYPEIWHPWSGERQAIAQTRPEPGLIRMHLHLESLESQFILFGRNPPERMPRKGVKLLPSLTSPNRACVGMKKAISGKAGGKCFHIDLSSGWHFRFHDQAAGRELPGLPEWRFLRPEEPFSGAGTYQRTFTIRTLPANTMASLDLGQVREVAKVWLNGHLIDVLFWPPYRLDASYALKAGENDIRVEVMNNICCRMDQVWKPSGLLGPVRLHFGERED